jgi:hypothetical protein
MTKRKAILPLSLAGPGNQFCGIKEALLIAHVLKMDVALPRVIPHGTIRNKAESSYGFDETFDLERFRLACSQELDVNVIELTADTHFLNIMMRGDEASRNQAVQYFELHNKALGLREDNLQSLADTPNARMLTSVAEIEAWGDAITQLSGFEEAQVISLIGIFNSIKLGGINTESDAAPCNKNHCLNCPPNAELADIHDRVNQCFRFSKSISDVGDQLIHRLFGDHAFAAFHLRICDLPQNRTFKECYSGYTEEEVVSAVHRITAAASVDTANVFLAAPPQLFTAVNDLGLVNDGRLFKTASEDVAEDPYYASLVEQYVCSKASVFIRSYTNTPDIERKRHTRSSWSELVEGIRRSDGNNANLTIDDEINASSSLSAENSDGSSAESASANSITAGTLEPGDYLPNMYIENEHAKLDLQNWATKAFYILCDESETPVNRQDIPGEVTALFGDLLVINAEPSKETNSAIFHDRSIWDYLRSGNKGVVVYQVGQNLKISAVYNVAEINQLSELSISPPTCRNIPAPVITIPSAVTPELADRLISELDQQPDNTSVRDDGFKRRTHLQTNAELSDLIDKKLVKSVFPEIEKAFYARITHRETYKICLYDGENSGAFGKHRDTIDPYRHRRYAMTLALNDDYQGGGICFPEYSPEVVPLEKYSAVIFPGSLFHEVKPIASGKRYVVISFFFGDDEAAIKEGSEQYKINAERGVDDLSVRSITPTSMDET